MYDPEFNLVLERMMQEMVACSDKARELVGDNHPVIKVMEGFDRAWEQMRDLKDDFDNCFDVETKKKLATEIRQRNEELSRLWSEFAKRAGI